MRNKKFILLIFLLVTLLIFVACKGKENKKPEVKNEPTTTKEKYINFVYRGKIISKTNVDKYSEIVDEFENVYNKYKTKENVIGLFAFDKKLEKNYFENNDDLVLQDIYGVYKNRKLEYSKDLTIFVKEKYDNYRYSYTWDDGVLLEKDNINDSKYNVLLEKIPSMVNETPVLELGSELYMGRKLKEGLKLPDTIKRIGKATFAGASIEKIKLSKNLEEIGEFAFAGRWNREIVLGGADGKTPVRSYDWLRHIPKNYSGRPFTLVIPGKVKNLGTNSFVSNGQIRELIFKTDEMSSLMGVYDMPKLQYIKLPGKIKKMGYLAGFPSGIKNFVMPYSIGQLIDEYKPGIGLDGLASGFMNDVGDCGVDGRFSITLNDNFLPIIGFNDNHSLREVVVKNGVKQLRGFTSKNLERVIFEEGIEYIGKGSFSGSEKLKEVTFPKSLKVIDQAFLNNKNLYKVIFNEGLEVIGKNNYLERNKYEKENLLYPSVLREVSSNLSTFSFSAISNLELPKSLLKVQGFDNIKLLKNIQFNNKLVKIDGFNGVDINLIDLSKTSLEMLKGFNNTKIETIKLPDTLKSINGFLNKSVYIKNVDFPSNIQLIEGSFNNLSSITSIDIKDSVSDVYDSFNGLTSLESLTIGKSFKSTNNILKNSYKLSNIIIKTNEIFKYENGVFFDDINKILYRANYLEDVPKSLNTTELGTIYGIKPGKTTLMFPDQFTQYRRLYSEDIKKVKIDYSKSLSLSSNLAFSNLSYSPTFEKHSPFALKLKNAETINKITFGNYEGSYNSLSNRFINLKTIKIPAHVSVHALLFNDRYVTKVVLENGREKLRASCFSSMPNLIELILPNTLKSIWEYEFAKMTNIKRIKIPGSVTYMGSNAFFGWTSAQTIELDFKENGMPKLKRNQNYSVVDGWARGDESIGIMGSTPDAWNNESAAQIVYLK